MRKYICLFLFVLLYLTSCTISAGESAAVAAEMEQKENEEVVFTEEELRPNLTVKNDSPYNIVVFKDSLRQKELCSINAYEAKAVYDEESLSDVVYYITYYIRLSNDFSIPYYSNESFVILPYRKNKVKELKISWPDKLQIEDCYIIFENNSNRELVFKNGSYELFSLDKSGIEYELSPILLPDEKGMYKISPLYFNMTYDFTLQSLNGIVFKLSDKLVSLNPGRVYKFIVQNNANGKLDCLLKSVSTFVSDGLNQKAVEEISYVTISYQTNYSSKIASKKIPIGTSLSTAQLPDLKRTAYNFKGWYLGSDKITSGYIAMNDITISAAWECIHYTAAALNQIDLSKLEDDYTLHISGKITDSDLDQIAVIIQKANKNITLDISKVSGLKEIKCNGISEYNSRFGSCLYLKSIILPKDLQKLGDYAFTYCRYLECIEISEGTTSIADLVFYQCKKLNTVIIPESVVSIGYGAFSYCNSLGTITYKGTKAQWNLISKNNWRENAYSRVARVVCSDGAIDLNK